MKKINIEQLLIHQHNEKYYDINLMQKDVTGGKISKEQIDNIIKYPQAKSVIVSGLYQDTFEYFIDNYGKQFEVITFWKNKNVKDLSKLSQLSNVRMIVYFYNNKVTKLWDLSDNVNLQILELWNFKNLHSIEGIQKANKLEHFSIGAQAGGKMLIDTLKPLVNSNISYFGCYTVVGDNNYNILSKTKLRQLDINIEAFTLDEQARFNSLFTPSLEGSVAKPYYKFGIKEIDGTCKEYYVLCKGNKTLMANKDEIKFKKYLNNYEKFLLFYKQGGKKGGRNSVLGTK